MKKLKEYIASLNAIVEKNPAAADFDVVYSRDDEGNDYQGIRYEPSKGKFSGGEFDESCSADECNAVCVN